MEESYGSRSNDEMNEESIDEQICIEGSSFCDVNMDHPTLKPHKYLHSHNIEQPQTKISLIDERRHVKT